ncbi:MAG TPA: hypothetical protein VGL02_06685 [Streptomyces sp.]
MPIKVFCVLAGLAATACAAVLITATGTPWWVAVLELAGVVAALRWWAAGEILRGAAFAGVSEAARRWMLRAVMAAVVAHATWLALFLLIEPELWTSSWWQWIAAPLLVAGVELLVAVAWDHRIRRVRPAERNLPVPVVHEAEFVGRPDTPVEQFRRALALIERDYIQVPDDGWRELDYGMPLPEGITLLGFVFVCRLPSVAMVRMQAEQAARQAGRQPGRGEVKPLTSGDAEMLAIAWSEVTGVPMMADWVHVTRERLAGVTTVTVLMVDAHSMAFPYPLERTHRAGRALLGLQVDARPVEYNPRQHLALVGPTGSGKSGALNVLLAEVTLPDEPDGPLPEVVVGGCRKVYDLVGQWFDPFLTPDLADLPLPFRAVNGFRDTLNTLVELLDEAMRRQGLPHAERAALHDIYLAIDEVPVFLTHPGQVQWQGRWYSASALYAEGRQTLRSAGIFLIDLAQVWSNAMYGDAAPVIKKNAPALMLMRSMDGDERGDMFGRGGADLGHLYQPGQFYLRDGAAPIQGKTFYLQEADARMRRLHDGPSIGDVAVARARMRAARGDYSTGRMSTDLRDYLRGTGEDAERRDEGVLSVREQVGQLLAELEAGAPAVQPVQAEAPRPVKPPTWADRIVELVAAAEEPVAPKQILAGLPGLTESMMHKQLGMLRKSGRLSQPRAGVYSAP